MIPEKLEGNEALWESASSSVGGPAVGGPLAPIPTGGDPAGSPLSVVNLELAYAAGQLRCKLLGVSGHLAAICLRPTRY